MSFLLQRGLIAEQRPRADAPAVLVTTPECLSYLGLKSLDELPSLLAVRDAARTIAVVTPLVKPR